MQVAELSSDLCRRLHLFLLERNLICAKLFKKSISQQFNFPYPDGQYNANFTYPYTSLLAKDPIYIKLI